MKKIPVCINLDSLALGSGWRLSFTDDPTYRLVDERLISRLEKEGIKATLFVVGKDLESPKNREFVKKWSRAGHEIGNHTYSHPLNLASLSGREIGIEIEKTHREIKRITGKQPVSFNASGWAVSDDIDRALVKLKYRFDYSPFLSWWIYPLLLKQWWGLRGERIAGTVWRRRDIFYPLKLTRKQLSYDKNLTKIPVPTISPFSIPIWHTGWFIFGEKIFPRLLKSAMKENSAFYYLMHPADIIDINDIPVGFKDKVVFERLNISLKDKIEYLDSALKLLL